MSPLPTVHNALLIALITGIHGAGLHIQNADTTIGHNAEKGKLLRGFSELKSYSYH